MASTSDLKDPDHLEASSNTTNEEVNSSSQTFIIQESPKPQILQDQLQSTATQASSPTKLFVEEAKPIKHSDPREPMAPFEWDSLEKRYLKTMEECEQEERKIYQEFHDWVKVFETWASITCVHENDRAYKRLKTRMSFVQTAEERLEEKRRHYDNVVKAFESALALLGSTS